MWASEAGDLQPRAELAAAQSWFFGQPPPAVLRIEGEPGIGKSTAWGLCIERAWQSAISVLACRGSESEESLAFCGLTDLLGDQLELLNDSIPAASLATLRAALLPAPGPQDEYSERDVGLAVTTALRALAGRGEVLIAVDDAQWLDRPTVEALCFALRRLRSEPVRVLICARLTDDGSHSDVADRLWAASSHERRTSLLLAGFPPLTLAKIVRSRLDVEIGPRVAHELAERSNGNPFWAMEIIAAAGGAPTSPIDLPLPASRADLLERRVRALPGNVRTVLATVAALSRPSIDKVVAALAEVIDEPDRAVDAAVDAVVVTESAGMLRPAHPLLGAAALHLVPPLQRRRLHVRFAQLTTDPEQRALHLALAAPDGPDPEVAGALDVGVEHARRRGAAYTAADLADRAVAFTPPADVESANRRRLTAGALNFATGDLVTACSHVEGVWAHRDQCQDWPQMLALLIELTYWVHGRTAAETLVAQVLELYPADGPRRLLGLALAADVGDGLGTPRAELAEQAIDLAGRLDDPDPWAVSTARLYLASARLDSGYGIDHVSLREAAAAEQELQRRRPHWTPVLNRAGSHLAYFLKIVDDLSGSRHHLLRCIDIALAEGDDGSLAALYGHLALTECWAGDYPAAAAAAAAGTERATYGGGVVPVVLHAAGALTSLHTGQFEPAGEILAAQLPDPLHPPRSIKGVVMLHIAGLAELLQGRAVAAADLLGAALALAVELGISEPGRRQRLEGDLGAALAETGRFEELDALATAQTSWGTEHHRPVILGVGHRLAALAGSGRGDLATARRRAEQAVQAHRGAGFPLDLARSRLVLARIQRRQRARQAAAAETATAVGELKAIGAAGWLRLVDIEPPTPTGHLTAAERRVADLAAAGATNKEIAARLFVSVRTVEGHLSLVYRKLGVRHRSELAHHPELAGPVIR